MRKTLSAPNLAAGDRVAFSANFVRSTGQYTTGAANQRATFLGQDDQLGDPFVRVRWDHQPAILDTHRDDPKHCADILAKGSIVNVHNLARVGSLRFADASA